MTERQTLMMSRRVLIYFTALLVNQAMAGEPAQAMEIAALGRSFSLGALYDVRTEHLSALNLWDQSAITLGKHKEDKPYTDFKYRSVNRFNEKTEFMEIEASLQMSFMSGLVTVEGSAKYLEEKTSKGNSASVTMLLKKRNRVEWLTQKFFSDITYKQYLTRNDHTHVVTKIVYGADAYFKFSKEVKDNESRREIEGSLKAAITGITAQISASATATLNDQEMVNSETISVDFHGDFANIVPPKTFQQAIDVVNEISSSNASVPMKITLTPLHVLNSEAITLLSEVDDHTIGRAVELKSNFDQIDDELDIELDGQSVKYFPKLKINLNHVKRRFKKEAGIFTSQLRSLLPSIRSDQSPIESLIEVLNEADEGPLQKSYFDVWLKKRQQYANTLSKQFKILENSNDITFLPDNNGLVDFQLSHRNSYYTLEGTLRGIDETYYINALDKNNASIADNEPEDTNSWVKEYKRPVIRILRKFERLSQLKNHNTKDFNNLLNVQSRKTTPQPSQQEEEKIGFPKRAIFIDMPSDDNKLEIKTYYGATQIKMKPLEELRFEEEQDHLQYNKQTSEDIELVKDENEEYYGDYDYNSEVEILGYEIQYREKNKRIFTHNVNILKKSSLRPGLTYEINARVILKGGVRGPWNKKHLLYTRSKDADQASILVTGGIIEDVQGKRTNRTASTEILGSCAYQPLPIEISSHSTVTTLDGTPLVCGGEDIDRKSNLDCFMFDTGSRVWKKHSIPQGDFSFGSMVSVSIGTYYFHDKTSQFLPIGSSDWAVGPKVPSGYVDHSCVVKINETHLFLAGIGRRHNGPGGGGGAQVQVYNVVTEEWTQWQDLPTKLSSHACIRTEEGILLSGGFDTESQFREPVFEAQTLLYDTTSGKHETVGAMTNARAGHELVKLKGKVLAVGGFTDVHHLPLRSIDEWVGSTKTWVRSRHSLQVGRAFFGVVSVPVSESVLCG